MFFLSLIEHTLRLPPHLLNRPLNEALKEQLDSIFLDKVSLSTSYFLSMFLRLLTRFDSARLCQVIDKIGLCVSIYDIRSINGGFIFPSDGASTYTVKVLHILVVNFGIGMLNFV